MAYPGRSKPESLGVIANRKKSILNLVHRLSPDGEAVGFCYEAGPCGYEVHRLIKETGHDCEVVAPSMIPKKAGERVKTDRRDAVKLASLFRSGELTSVWVPDEEQEAIRDLTRAREEMKRVELQLKQRVSASRISASWSWRSIGLGGRCQLPSDLNRCSTTSSMASNR